MFNISEEELRKLYLMDNFSAREISEKYNVSIDSIKSRLRKFRILKSPELASQKKKEGALGIRKKTCLKKYGVEHPLQNGTIKEKLHKTNLQRYGVKNALENKNVQEKRKSTMMNRYSVLYPIQCTFIKERIEKTNIIKYGVENCFKNKEVQEKRKTTMRKKYGVDTPWKSKEIKKKQENTMKSRYGEVIPMKVKSIKEKIEETNRQRYGTKTPLESEYIRKKIKQTNLNRYGVETAIASEYIKEKIKKTNLKKYGVINPGNLRKFRIKAVKSSKSKLSKIDKISRFDSSYERDLYDYCLTNNIKIDDMQIPIKYEYKGIEHTTFIDFKIEGQLVECKGGHLLEGIYDYALNVPIQKKLEIYRDNKVKLITDKRGIKALQRYQIQLIVEDIQHFKTK